MAPVPTLTANAAAARRVGPGVLYAAPLGSTEPGPSAAFPSAWIQLGYTDGGHTDSVDIATADIPVAEEFDPVDVVTTGRTATVAFTLAEMTAEHLALAYNQGLDAITAEAGFKRVDMTDIGEEVHIMLGWDALDGKERKIWRECVNTGTVSDARNKAPNRAQIPFSWRVLVPAGGESPKTYWSSVTSS